MFKILKAKSKTELLNKQYKKLLKESYKLSTINRKASDVKAAEADRVLKEIERLEGEKND